MIKFRSLYSYEIVEPAHMELAEPSISTAYKRCVEQGARQIICHPYFLSRGRHVMEDIPQLLADAAKEFRETEYILTEPLGMRDEIVHIMEKAIAQSLSNQKL